MREPVTKIVILYANMLSFLMQKYKKVNFVSKNITPGGRNTIKGRCEIFLIEKGGGWRYTKYGNHCYKGFYDTLPPDSFVNKYDQCVINVINL